MLPTVDELACQHLRGPDPDTKSLVNQALQIRGFLDTHGISNADGRYCTQCPCHASAKHMMECHGVQVFVCNPCLRSVIEYMTKGDAPKLWSPGGSPLPMRPPA